MLKFRMLGRNDSIVDRSLALHTDNLALIPGTPQSPLRSYKEFSLNM